MASTIIVVGAASLSNKSGQRQGLSADLVILLILGLSTMLDGYHIGWQFSLLGFFLIDCTIIIGYVNPFMWACVALAVVVIVGAIIKEFIAQASGRLILSAFFSRWGTS